MIPAVILQQTGLHPTAAVPVSGGDINQCWRLEVNGGPVFLKFNQAAPFPGMLQQEAAGLNQLRKGLAVVPQVLQYGEADQWQYLFLSWIAQEPSGPRFWEAAGRALAELHRCSAPAFGQMPDNYIGRLPQRNPDHPDWPSFYAQVRILPLVGQLVEQGALDASALRQAEQCCNRLPHLFPEEPPALLHGDLWSGNICCTTGQQPALFDPAVYYGHREMDLGMTLLFGGFHSRFYDAYAECYPPEKNWRRRLPLTQLYPLVVHACLFGGHYITEVRSILRKEG
ncbi:MAG TPA: fructosamine kinase family protein [Lacibacter sp.]|nr:fructosamine kinase family protein [Lacibacter sp.]HMO90068.1 fructosamine kinase family protein [Lacibacter sp.]HMP85745.1 fructosamine kinase family protein [Lacibacter sp.]